MASHSAPYLFHVPRSTFHSLRIVCARYGSAGVTRKLVGGLHGAGALIALIGGFGTLARLGTG